MATSTATTQSLFSGLSEQMAGTLLRNISHSNGSFTPPMDMRRRVRDLDSLPMLPDTGRRLLELSADESATAHDLALLVERDPSLAAQMMRWARSPLYGYRGEINSVEDAVVRVLGFDRVLNIALGLVALESLNVPVDGPCGLRNYWRHAIYTASLVGKLEQKLDPVERAPQGLAYLTGLLASADNVLAVAELLRRYPDVPVVVDPVLASGSGTSLGNAQLVGALREQLLPLTTVLTPNTLEARTLAMQSGDEVSDNSPGAWAKILLQTGCDHVLITGTHAPHDDVVNRCYHGDKTQHQTWPRLEGDYHGSGCTLASAIAAYIAKGQDIAGSINQAQAYTWNSLERAYPIGRGQHIPNRLVDPASSA